MFSDSACKTLEDVCLCSIPAIRSMHTDLARALQLINTSSITKVIHQFPSLFTRIINVIDSIVSKHTEVTVSSLHIIINILKAYVVAEPLNDYIDNALAFIALNSNFSSSSKNAIQYRLLRSPMLILCLTALERKPLSDAKPDSILLDICDGPSLTVKEMAPLLGDQGKKRLFFILNFLFFYLIFI